MTKLKRDELELFIRHSDIKQPEVEKLLDADLYADDKSWKRFLLLLLAVLGIGFTVVGIIFFFAYNWADLHKFVKLGMLQALVLVSTVIALRANTSLLLKNCLLTAASVLVGGLFAVFGQVYQTGANAYDFFLGWTACIFLWALVANFAPLWLLFIGLVNTTIMLYHTQVAYDQNSTYEVMFLINGIILLAFHLLQGWRNNKPQPTWFLQTLGLATIIFATLAMCFYVSLSLSQMSIPYLVLLSSATVTTLALAYWYAIRRKEAFYLAVAPFALLTLIAYMLLRISDKEGMFLSVCLLIIAGVALITRNIIITQKKWHHGVD